MPAPSLRVSNDALADSATSAESSRERPGASPSQKGNGRRRAVRIVNANAAGFARA